jgi:4-diphosphocytidyl-2-C-methyl-D-erythritol kinase
VNSLTLFSCAKINLFLAILGKRKDGFHELVSLYQAIDLYDTITFSLSEQDEFTSSCSSIQNRDNLVVKALNLFRSYTQKKFCITIHLDKKIPIGSGLGGASSNAATTLWGLNQLLGFPLSLDELLKLGSQIGSDVNFFFSSGSALCTSRGEVIHNLPDLPHQKFTIVKPSYSLATPEVYAHVDLSKIQGTIRNFDQILDGFYHNRPTYFNDLEKAAFSLKPEMLALKKDLIQLGFSHVLMTGSGSAFLCFGSRSLNEKFLFAHPDLSYFVVSFIQRNSSSWYDPKK